MRHALIMAGGKGTRLWPMSVEDRPKQLIPFINGRHLLGIAYDRLEGLVDPEHRFVCAGNIHRDAIMTAVPGLTDARYLGEPEGRDTLAALGFSAVVIGATDPDAVIAIFTADHIIEPVDRFREIIRFGYELVESSRDMLLTFGITPTHAATGYGYLELGESIESKPGARLLTRFKEKPDERTAGEYLKAGPDRYLWNSGMFVWRAETLLGCIERYEPELHRGLTRIAKAVGTAEFSRVVNEVYPELKKTSVDFGVMEPASRDDTVQVAAVPMDLTWLDIGSWPAYEETCESDEKGNAISGGDACLLDSSSNLVVGTDGHLIAGIGLEDMIVIHTPKATLVCPKDRDQEIKRLHAAVAEQFGDEYL